MSKFHTKPYSLCVAVLVLLLAGTLTGCDYYHRLKFTNKTSQKLIVVPEGYGLQLELDPCSVKWGIWMDGPLPNQPITVTVVNDAKSVSFLRTIRAPVRRGKITYDIETMDEGICPAEITGSYIITIINQTSSKLAILNKTDTIGTVDSSSTATLGPFPGQVEEIIGDIGFALITKEGQVKREISWDSNSSIEYPLGKIPADVITIRQIYE